MTATIGIEGFGRIGKLVLKAAIGKGATVVVVIDPFIHLDYMDYMFKYDSDHGKFVGEVSEDRRFLYVTGNNITVFNERDPTNIDWAGAGAEYVVGSAEVFTTTDMALSLTKGRADKVTITDHSAEAPMAVMGVNYKKYAQSLQVVSRTSCPANCLAQLAQVISDLKTTANAATTTQKLVDGRSGKNWREGRGAAWNIFPSSSGSITAEANWTWKFPNGNSVFPFESVFDIMVKTPVGPAVNTPVIVKDMDHDNDQVGLSRAATGCVVTCLFKKFQISASFESLIETVPGIKESLLKLDRKVMDFEEQKQNLEEDTPFREKFEVVQQLLTNRKNGVGSKNNAEEIMDCAAQAFLVTKIMDKTMDKIQTSLYVIIFAGYVSDHAVCARNAMESQQYLQRPKVTKRSAFKK